LLKFVGHLIVGRSNKLPRGVVLNEGGGGQKSLTSGKGGQLTGLLLGLKWSKHRGDRPSEPTGTEKKGIRKNQGKRDRKKKKTKVGERNVELDLN